MQPMLRATDHKPEYLISLPIQLKLLYTVRSQLDFQSRACPEEVEVNAKVVNRSTRSDQRSTRNKHETPLDQLI